jgi:hypothetical protein
MPKEIDPLETYVVRAMFGCGEGHALPPGFTHWEEGEACTFGHEVDVKQAHYYHLYWRLYLVPMHIGTKEDRYDPRSGLLWEERISQNPNKWGQYALAPKGLKEGKIVRPRQAA